MPLNAPIENVLALGISRLEHQTKHENFLLIMYM